MTHTEADAKLCSEILGCRFEGDRTVDVNGWHVAVKSFVSV